MLAATHLAAVLVVVASLYTGINALSRDIDLAFELTPSSVIQGPVAQQIDAVRNVVPPGSAILYVASPQDSWYPHLFQRALFPRNTVIVRYPPPESSTESLASVCARYGVRYAIWQGGAPAGMRTAQPLDLGLLPGLESSTSLAALSP